MVVETPAKGSVTTSLVCLKCPLSRFGRDFAVDLVCLPLSGMDVILGMNWLEFNHVVLDLPKGFLTHPLRPNITPSPNPTFGIIAHNIPPLLKGGCTKQRDRFNEPQRLSCTLCTFPQ
jgi:hypothetical protein